jgi:hypothetical protein
MEEQEERGAGEPGWCLVFVRPIIKKLSQKIYNFFNKNING